MTTEEKIARARASYHGGISRVDETGTPRRGWRFCSHPECLEVIRKRRGERCEQHLEAR